jgi:hypothetical protein
MVPAQRVMGLACRDEIGRHQARALVQQLKERVLGIGSRRPPDDGARIVVNRSAVARHAFAARFHVELLQVGRQQRERIVVGQDRMRRGAAKIVIPDAEQGEDYGHVALGRRSAEMLVHGPRAAQ